MRPRDVRVYVIDALAACAAIRGFVAGMSLEGYLGDMMVRSAVERQFEIVGESLAQARSVDHGLIDRVPQARGVIAFRNQLIHGYALVDDEIVWGNVELLDDLVAALQAEIMHSPRDYA